MSVNEPTKLNIDIAKKEVKNTYAALSPIVKEVVSKHSKEMDAIINTIKAKTKGGSSLSSKEIKDYMLALSIETYDFAQSKDMSILMQECAIAVAKTSQAEIFNSTVGTQAVRSNQSIVDSMDKQVVAMLQSAVANCMKSKLDEAHRIVNTLSGILISMNAENKLKGVPTDNGEGDLHSNSFSEDSP